MHGYHTFLNPTYTQVKAMSSDDSIEPWLEAINLHEYVPSLISQGYNTLDKCATIRDKTALKELGVTKVGHLNRLFRAIEKLRGEDSGAMTLPPNATLEAWAPADRKSKSLTLITSKCIHAHTPSRAAFGVRGEIRKIKKM